MAKVTPAQAYLANGNDVEMKIGEVDLTPVLKGLPDFAENREQERNERMHQGNYEPYFGQRTRSADKRVGYIAAERICGGLRKGLL